MFRFAYILVMCIVSLKEILQETCSGEYPRCASTKGRASRALTWGKGRLYSCADTNTHFCYLLINSSIVEAIIYSVLK